MSQIIFFVRGKPIAKGSTKAITLPGHSYSTLISTAKGLKKWARDVAMVAKANRPTSPAEDGVVLGLTFQMPRPKRCKRDVPSVRPDLDKLARAILDALKGTFYCDDGQVIGLNASKVYSDDPGVMIEVRG